MHPHSRGFVYFVSADSLEQLGQRHPGLHARQVRAQAESGRRCETHQFGADLAIDAVLVGILEDPFVAVGRADQQHQHVARGHRGVVVRLVLDDQPGQDLAGGVVAQGLLYPRHDQLVVVEHRSQLVGILVAPICGVGKKFGGRLVSGDHHQEQEGHDLVIGEPVTVDLGIHQCRRQVVGAVLAALLHHVGVVDQ